MLFHMRKVAVLFCISLLMVLMVVIGQSSDGKIIDLDKGEESIRIMGDDASDLSGNPIARGDINGDGYDDVIIAASRANPAGGTKAGETYVIFGSASPAATIDLDSVSADMTIYGNDAFDYSGTAVSSGDINGDGYDDVIIGAEYADPTGGSEAGETYVIFGSSSPPATIDLDSVSADVTIYGDDASDYSGHSVASGDVNGDGYDDVIIGAYAADPTGGSEAGETYVIFGSSSPPATIDLNSVSADMTIYGDDASDYSGHSVASGDVNGDGYDDVIITAHLADTAGGTDAGETYVIFGSDSPPATIDLNSVSADMTIYGDDAGDESGHRFSNGDINGDGYDDVIIGAWKADPAGGSEAGETYVIFGSTSPPATIDLNSVSADMTIYGDNAGDYSGTAVSSGDINGDGYDEAIIGANLADPAGGTDAGKTYVIFGSDSPPATIDLNSLSADITIYGDDASDHSGTAVARADVNADGYDDVIIGAFDADPPGGTDAGETYVIFGSGSDISVGQGPGASSWVRDFHATKGNLLKSWQAFGSANTNGEVSVAKGDVTGDDEPEIVVGQRSIGAASYVRVFKQDGTLLWGFQSFGAGNTNGMVNVAVGDVDVDSIGEIVVGQGPGGNSYVRIFEYGNSTAVTTWKAFGSSNTNGEVRVAAGQTAPGLSFGQIITGEGHGGQSYVKVWDYAIPPILYHAFRAFGRRNPSGGVDVGVGNFDNDPMGINLIAVGQGGPGQTTATSASSYFRIFDELGFLFKTYRAFGAVNTKGRVTVSAGQADGDAADEIIVGQAVGGNSYWRVLDLDDNLNVTVLLTVKAFGGDNSNGQVDVAGCRTFSGGTSTLTNKPKRRYR